MNDKITFGRSPIRRAVALLMTAALLSAGTPALAQTQCSRAAMSGQWAGAFDGDYICNFTVRNNGRFSGTCVEDDGDTYRVQGNFNLAANCTMRARIRFIDERRTYTGAGRVWGTSTNRPEVGLVVSSQPRRFFDLHMYRRP